MRYAIYFVAIGDPAISCFELAHKTLRNAGFSGDVYILSDKDDFLLGKSSNTTVIKIRDEDINLDEYTNKEKAFFDIRDLDASNFRNVRNKRKWTICRAKTLIDKYISFSNYDYVIYLDVDVLTADPLKLFEDFLSSHNGAIITAQSKGEPRLGGRGNFSLRQFCRVRTAFAANLTNLELLRYWFVKPICSDAICVPTNADGKLLFKKWRVECKKNIDYDQPALQAILLRHFRKLHVLAPFKLFGHGPKHNEDVTKDKPEKVASVFIHFGGAVKDPTVFRRYYKEYLS